MSSDFLVELLDVGLKSLSWWLEALGLSSPSDRISREDLSELESLMELLDVGLKSLSWQFEGSFRSSWLKV